jgi:hypothetical protein
MGCCGKRRMRVSRARPMTMSKGQLVRIEYTGSRLVTVRGPITRKIYSFSAHRRVQNIDLRDATLILRSPYFRTAGVARGSNNV